MYLLWWTAFSDQWKDCWSHPLDVAGRTSTSLKLSDMSCSSVASPICQEGQLGEKNLPDFCLFFPIFAFSSRFFFFFQVYLILSLFGKFFACSGVGEAWSNSEFWGVARLHWSSLRVLTSFTSACFHILDLQTKIIQTVKTCELIFVCTSPCFNESNLISSIYQSLSIWAHPVYTHCDVFKMNTLFTWTWRVCFLLNSGVALCGVNKGLWRTNFGFGAQIYILGCFGDHFFP